MKNVFLYTAMTMAFINFAHGKSQEEDDKFCPDKKEFMAELIKKENIKEANKDGSFHFKANNQQGKGKPEEWKAADFEIKAKDAKWDNAAHLEIRYHTKKDVTDYCEAQLHARNDNKDAQLVVYLRKKEHQQ